MKGVDIDHWSKGASLALCEPDSEMRYTIRNYETIGL